MSLPWPWLGGSGVVVVAPLLGVGGRLVAPDGSVGLVDSRCGGCGLGCAGREGVGRECVAGGGVVRVGLLGFDAFGTFDGFDVFVAFAFGFDGFAAFVAFGFGLDAFGGFGFVGGDAAGVVGVGVLIGGGVTGNSFGNRSDGRDGVEGVAVEGALDPPTGAGGGSSSPGMSSTAGGISSVEPRSRVDVRAPVVGAGAAPAARLTPVTDSSAGAIPAGAEVLLPPPPEVAVEAACAAAERLTTSAGTAPGLTESCSSGNGDRGSP